jgi:hypothetical protein
MIEPKPVEIVTMAGETRTYILSKFPAIQGREIVANYPLTALPKVGDYPANEAIMLKLMAHVAVPRDGGEPIALTTRDLVNNHVPDWETLAKIEVEMLGYNTSFFTNGKTSTFFAGIEAKARQWIIGMLTDLSAQSSPKAKRRSRN